MHVITQKQTIREREEQLFVVDPFEYSLEADRIDDRVVVLWILFRRSGRPNTNHFVIDVLLLCLASARISDTSSR
jgi:hypothetical protein